MPFCQSAVLGFLAAEVTDFVCEMKGVDNRKKELLKAGACAVVGGTSAVATVDPAGGGIVVAETLTHLTAAAFDLKLPKLPPTLTHG